MAQPDDQECFWRNLLRAVEVEPRGAKSLRGSSGVDHPITAVGIDQARRRLVVVTSEGDPRTAAFIQSDLQLAFPDEKIIVVRPDLYDRTSMLAGCAELPHVDNVEDLAKALDSPVFGEMLANVGKSLRVTTNLDLWNDIGLGSQTVRTYLILLFSAFLQLIPPDKRVSALQPIAGLSSEADALVGICGIPVYKFTEVDAELVRRGGDLEGIRHLLRRLDTLQYFFPPPDQLALGLIDRVMPTPDALIAQLELSVERGHPFGQNELVAPTASLTTLIDTLQDKGYVIEGERTIEVTAAGKSIRETLKFKPRESLISKIINQFSLKIDLKDLLK
jgi:hypothetical protein